MGKMNLLKASYQGKVGETVGQKWKNQTSLCTYTKHGDAKSPAQLEQRRRHKLAIQVLSYFYNNKPYLFQTSDPHLTKFQHIQKENRNFLSKDTLTFSDLQSLAKHVRIGTPARMNIPSASRLFKIEYTGYNQAIEKSHEFVCLARNTDTDYYKIVKSSFADMRYDYSDVKQNVQIVAWAISELFEQIDGKNILEIHWAQFTGNEHINIEQFKPLVNG